ncbi:polysaccharide pyruvyl transferase family protein [Paracoccus siganidrum]|nr:polysaccharide pyruvyl transferase family protein [Paracoccus siganidrum]RMC35124.1 hypothetical protein C9E82_10955 [Paracoccus siganidrum]
MQNENRLRPENPGAQAAHLPDDRTRGHADVLFCSFHTSDDYYADAAARLRASLDGLGIRHEIAEVHKAPGEEWPEICRRKVPFLHSVCMANPAARVFWIDVDCDIDYLPGFVAGFSADIIGFQRGFGHPMRIGYANSARFWEPCFWGINATPAARAYIEDANAAATRMTIRATDDFFFEEAWRKNADRLSFQMIPSAMLLGRADRPETGQKPFFYFGSSGNVASFKGVAAQHSRNARPATGAPAPGTRSLALRTARRVQDALPPAIAAPLRRISDRIGMTELLSPSVPASAQLSPRSIYRIIHDAREGRAEAVEARLQDIAARRLLSATDQAVIGAARAFLDYGGRGGTEGGGGDPLRLLWWDKPYPGNFGDWLSPLILSAATRRPVRFQAHDDPGAAPHLVAVGSIGRFARQSSILFGTGVSRSDALLPPDATYISLRGPYSAQAVAEAGGPRIERFGDPAAILPRLLPIARPVRTNGRIALVRHFAHRGVSLRLPEQVDEHSVLCSGRQEIARLIETLVGYDAVLTSAMHIQIICQAYGIPVGLITFEGFEDAVHGDRIKYRDYAAGVGLPEKLPLAVDHDLRHRALDLLIADDRIPATAMADIEGALAEAVAAHDRAAGHAGGTSQQREKARP